MRMGKIPKAIVEQDFTYIVNNYLHKEYAEQLSNERENENIRFQVTRDLGLDGETNFGKRKRRCRSEIQIHMLEEGTISTGKYLRDKNMERCGRM